MPGSIPGPALLFCPADRPDRFAKAASRADGVILDLEDAVAPGARPAAREALVAHGPALLPERTIVRISPPGTPDHERDLAAVRATSFRTVMVAKADASLPVLDGLGVVALCETAAGVVDAPALARRDDVVALMWGAEDLVASLGGASSRFGPGERAPGAYRDVARHARAAVLLAAGAAGKQAIDAVHLDIDDLDGLRAEAADAVASGFAATACIHPRHVAAIREAYAPTPDEVVRAERILAAAAGHEAGGAGGAGAGGTGVFTLDGVMVDEPVLRHARAVLERARG
ncbi:HpcH/HpaI aldolase/citrate lyase family protein [Myceligenerans pegani]|uniref:CoA ester lyase n=1 Tax=Myceligenerans pegani TaxID=2776917 RepID=A0ABR9N3B8_9MICO|nr:CoA ester lyase [Myceligenerans sp. TRM 65318]MBE1878145.1 CoA ester lyase [Myceligenerans sp. TRM 65318]MBE3020416.1 CoA ester lyase [Myceligenerans sp. TRM 65318]